MPNPVVIKIEADAEQAQQALKRFSAEAEKHWDKITQTADGASKKMQKSVESLSGGFDSLIKNFERAAMVGGVALAAGVAVGIKSAMDYEQQLAKVNISLSESTQKYLPQYKSQIEAVSARVGTDVSQMTLAFQKLLSAGMEPVKAMQVLSQAAEMADANFTSVAVTTEALTTVLNSYKLGAESAASVSDALSVIAYKGGISMEELSTSLGRVAPVAAAAGLQMEDLGAMIMTLSQKGVPARQTMSSLMGVLEAMQKPSEDAVTAAQKYGVALNENTLRTEGLLPVMGKLVNATDEELDKIFGSAAAFRALSVVLNDAAKYQENYMLMVQRAGFTQKAYEEANRTTKEALGDLWNAVKLVATSVGEVFIPYIKQAADKMIEWVQRMRESKGFQVFIDNIGKGIEVLKDIVTGVMAFADRWKFALGTVVAAIVAADIAVHLLKIKTAVSTVMMALQALSGINIGSAVSGQLTQIGLSAEKAATLSWGLQAALFAVAAVEIGAIIKGIWDLVSAHNQLKATRTESEEIQARFIQQLEKQTGIEFQGYEQARRYYQQNKGDLLAEMTIKKSIEQLNINIVEGMRKGAEEQRKLRDEATQYWVDFQNQYALAVRTLTAQQKVDIEFAIRADPTAVKAMVDDLKNKIAVISPDIQKSVAEPLKKAFLEAASSGEIRVFAKTLYNLLATALDQAIKEALFKAAIPPDLLKRLQEAFTLALNVDIGTAAMDLSAVRTVLDEMGTRMQRVIQIMPELNTQFGMIKTGIQDAFYSTQSFRLETDALSPSLQNENLAVSGVTMAFNVYKDTLINTNGQMVQMSSALRSHLASMSAIKLEAWLAAHGYDIIRGSVDGASGAIRSSTQSVNNARGPLNGLSNELISTSYNSDRTKNSIWGLGEEETRTGNKANHLINQSYNIGNALDYDIGRANETQRSLSNLGISIIQIGNKFNLITASVQNYGLALQYAMSRPFSPGQITTVRYGGITGGERSRRIIQEIGTPVLPPEGVEKEKPEKMEPRVIIQSPITINADIRELADLIREEIVPEIERLARYGQTKIVSTG